MTMGGMKTGCKMKACIPAWKAIGLEKGCNYSYERVGVLNELRSWFQRSNYFTNSLMPWRPDGQELW